MSPVIKRYVLAGAISSILSSLIAVVYGAFLVIGPGLFLGISIVIAHRSMIPEKLNIYSGVVWPLLGTSLAWFFPYLFANYFFSHTRDLSNFIPYELLVFVCGSGAGALGALLLTFVFVKVHKVQLTFSCYLKLLVLGGGVAGLIFPFVFLQFYLYVLLFLPWQVLVIWSITEHINEKI